MAARERTRLWGAEEVGDASISADTSVTGESGALRPLAAHEGMPLQVPLVAGGTASSDDDSISGELCTYFGETHTLPEEHQHSMSEVVIPAVVDRSETEPASQNFSVYSELTADENLGSDTHRANLSTSMVGERQDSDMQRSGLPNNLDLRTLLQPSFQNVGTVLRTIIAPVPESDATLEQHESLDAAHERRRAQETSMRVGQEHGVLQRNPIRLPSSGQPLLAPQPWRRAWRDIQTLRQREAAVGVPVPPPGLDPLVWHMLPPEARAQMRHEARGSEPPIEALRVGTLDGQLGAVVSRHSTARASIAGLPDTETSLRHVVPLAGRLSLGSKPAPGDAVGASGQAPPPLGDKGVCIVCADELANATFVHGSTGHTACCLPCALELERRGSACPICRQPFTAVIRNYST